MKNLFIKLRDSYQFAKFRFFFKRFYLSGYSVQYLAHRYNATWRNERALEIALIWNFLQKIQQEKPGLKALEVGNVLSHYYPINHTVVDKYERAVGVANTDILNFQSNDKFDVIIAISTIEHIGWHETDIDPFKTIKTVKKLKQLLNPGGILLITIPNGVNPFLDFFIKYKLISFGNHYYFKRINILNTWKRCGKSEYLNSKYNSPFGNANTICLGIYKKAL